MVAVPVRSEVVSVSVDRSGPPVGGPAFSGGRSLTGLARKRPFSASCRRRSSVRSSFEARRDAAESEPPDTLTWSTYLPSAACSSTPAMAARLGKVNIVPYPKRAVPIAGIENLQRHPDAVLLKRADLRTIVLAPE